MNSKKQVTRELGPGRSHRSRCPLVPVIAADTARLRATFSEGRRCPRSQRHSNRKARGPGRAEIPRHDLGRSGVQPPPVNDRQLVDLTAGNWSITSNREDDDGKLAQ